MFSMMRRTNHLVRIDPDFDTDFFNIRYRYYYKDEIVKLDIPFEQLGYQCHRLTFKGFL